MKILSIIVLCAFAIGCEVEPVTQVEADASADVSQKDVAIDSSKVDFGLFPEDVGVDVKVIDSGEPDADVDLCPSVGEVKVFLIGDSTVATNSGWGDAFDVRFNDDITVVNRGVGGSSSKSFYDQGRFDTTRDELSDGDFVLIQFGHNDSKPEEYRRTEPGSAPDFDDTFRENIERYLTEIKAKGGVPIMLTSVSRMTFSGDGSHSRTHGDYPAAAKKIAMDADVVLLDLEEYSHQAFDKLGDEETMELFAEAPDRTHFPPEKAFRVAEFVDALLRESNSPLRCSLLPE